MEIEHPKYYQLVINGKVYETNDVIDAILHYKIPDSRIAFSFANIVKYILRAPYKGSTKADLQKAYNYAANYVYPLIKQGVDLLAMPQEFEIFQHYQCGQKITLEDFVDALVEKVKPLAKTDVDFLKGLFYDLLYVNDFGHRNRVKSFEVFLETLQKLVKMAE